MAILLLIKKYDQHILDKRSKTILLLVNTKKSWTYKLYSIGKNICVFKPGINNSMLHKL